MGDLGIELTRLQIAVICLWAGFGLMLGPMLGQVSVIAAAMLVRFAWAIVRDQVYRLTKYHLAMKRAAREFKERHGG